MARFNRIVRSPRRTRGRRVRRGSAPRRKVIWLGEHCRVLAEGADGALLVRYRGRGRWVARTDVRAV